MSVVAVTVAVRGFPSSRASSPIVSPARMVPRYRPRQVASACPSTTIHHRSATSSSAQTTSPSATRRTPVTARVSPARSSSVQASNSSSPLSFTAVVGIVPSLLVDSDTYLPCITIVLRFRVGEPVTRRGRY